jgi:RNA polymerase sigma-B factor
MSSSEGVDMEQTTTLSAGATSTAPTLDPRFARYRETRDRRIRNELVEDHRWLGDHCVRRFTGKGEPTEDLRQVAVLGLVKAVDRFDPGRGFTFATFAVPTIVGELRRHFRDHGWSVRVGRRVKDNYLTVKAVADELQQGLGRSPLIPEIAERSELTEEDVLEALAAGGAYRGVPFDSARADDEDDEPDHVRALGRDDPAYVAVEARLVGPGLLDALPSDRERVIVKLRFVDELSQSQIAARLGLSQVHVSRLLRSSLQLMRSRLTA